MRRLKRAWTLAVAFVGTLIVWSCGGSDSTGPDTDPLDAVASLSVSPSASSVDIGSSTQLNATVRNGRNEVVSATVSWSSSATGIATVSSSGVVEGVSEGMATITATAGSRSGTAQITVTDPSPPAQPSNVVAMPVSDTDMLVTWTDNSDNEDSFQIERQAAAAAPAESAPSRQVVVAGTVAADVTEFLDTGLQAGGAYHYHVTACNANGCSEASPISEEVSTYEELAITTPSPLPGGAVGMPYNSALAAMGGDDTFSWGLNDGDLPDGLMVSEGGVISGTPTAPGQFDFTVQVEGGGQLVTADLSITIVSPPPTGVLVFESDPPGASGDIIRINPDGTGRTQLTFFPGTQDDEPSFPADGSKIAFRSDRDGNANIYIMDPDGTNQMRLTTNVAHDDEPDLSPDGSLVLFYSLRAGGDTDLFTINSDGTGPVTQLTFNTTKDDDAEWSADGTEIVFVSDQDGQNEIYIMDADGMNRRRLTNNPADDERPTWSPDGQWIAWETDRNGGTDDIYVIRPDGTDMRRVTTHAADDEEPAWSPDSQWMAFDSDRAGLDQIYITRTDGSEVTRVSFDGNDNDDVDWGPEFPE